MESIDKAINLMYRGIREKEKTNEQSAPICVATCFLYINLMRIRELIPLIEKTKASLTRPDGEECGMSDILTQKEISFLRLCAELRIRLSIQNGTPLPEIKLSK